MSAGVTEKSGFWELVPRTAKLKLCLREHNGHLLAYNLTKYDWYTATKDNAYQIPFDYLGRKV